MKVLSMVIDEWNGFQCLNDDHNHRAFTKVPTFYS